MFKTCLMRYRALSVLCLPGWMLLMSQSRAQTTDCPLPDFPEGGRYDPVKSEYQVGDIIAYDCPNYDLAIMGEGLRICQLDGTWSGETPFCDKPAKLKQITVQTVDSNLTTDSTSVIPPNIPGTCYRTGNGTGVLINFALDRPEVVYSVRTILREGTASYQIYIPADKNNPISKEYSCGPYIINTVDMAFQLNCKDHEIKGDFVNIHISSGISGESLTCALSIYATEENWCAKPPENSVANSQLEVSRSKAILHCNDGFKQDDQRIYATCESGKWHYKPLECKEVFCDPVFGSINPSRGEWNTVGGNFSIGSKRTLTCAVGHFAEGQPLTVTCGEDGMWTKSSATCKKNKNSVDYKTIAIVVGSIIIIVIIALVSIAVYWILRKKSEKMVVAYKT